MRIMALDIGEKRTGIAISDPAERVASPVCVLPTAEVVAGAAPFRRVLDDWEPRKARRPRASARRLSP